MWKAFIKWWRTNTDTKPTIKSIGTQKIGRDGQAQIIANQTISQHTGKITYVWENLLKYHDRHTYITCPKCDYCR